MTTKEYFERAFNYDKGDGRSAKVIAYAATWRVAYMAYEINSPEKGREVVALVCLINHVPNAKDGFTFGYKDMDESMGPCESKCPESILKLLTPTTYEYAIAWRQRCWDRINKRKAAPKVKSGMKVKFKEAIRFVGGITLDTLIFRRGSTFAHNFGLYRIPNWRERDFEVVS